MNKFISTKWNPPKYAYSIEESLQYAGEALGVKVVEKKKLLLNLDKREIMEPKRLTLSGDSKIGDIAMIHPRWGNPFQYEVFQLLMKKWKGDRLALVEDTHEMRDYLIQHERYTYYRNYKHKFRREIRKESDWISVISLDQTEVNRMQKRWGEFVNKYVLINYDHHLFMTLDQRLFKRTKNFMPYFVLAQTAEMAESIGSWAGTRVGIEPLATPTIDSLDYVEMFRMIGDKSVCQLGVEEYERQQARQNGTSPGS